MYQRTNNGVEKYNGITQDVVKIENDVIIGAGNTIIDKTDDKYVIWAKFNKPNSLKEYGLTAIELSSDDVSANYQLSDNGVPVFYDDIPGSNKLTLNPNGNDPAIIDGSDPEDLEANIRSDGNAVLKGINILVDCGNVNIQSIIDTGTEALNTQEREKNTGLALMENYDATQDLAVYNLIKDYTLDKTNFSAIITDIEGA